MKPLVTAQQMRIIDTAAFGGDTDRSYSFMEQASRSAADQLHRLMTPDEGVLRFYCGKGNNGGDGFCMARFSLQAGYSVEAVTPYPPESCTKETRRARRDFEGAGGRIQEIRSCEELRGLSAEACAVEALLGTGIHGPVRGTAAPWITELNRRNTLTVALDNPSGLDASTGTVHDGALQPDVTLTIAFHKTGHYFAAPAATGEIRLCPLTYPAKAVKAVDLTTSLLTDTDPADLIPQRSYFGSKYDQGTVLLIAGSRGMSGAVTLAARGALRSGCGMCYTAVARSLMDTLSVKLTEPVLLPLAETDSGSIACLKSDLMETALDRADALLLGCGMSRNTDTAALIRQQALSFSGPLVLDGDGISAFAEQASLLKDCPDCIITPHYGEYRRLFGTLPAAADRRIAAITETARTYGITVLFKGQPTIIAAPDGRVRLSTRGNSGLAAAGSGDVLAGIITALAAQGANSFDAAAAGAAIHGMAGDIGAQKLTEYGLTAGDLPTLIPHALKAYSPQEEFSAPRRFR
ncbi:MAG: NAD(P)H-hydrate dehydratase [Fibrobacterota bacterium]